MTTLYKAAQKALDTLYSIESPLSVKEIIKIGEAIASLKSALEIDKCNGMPFVEGLLSVMQNKTNCYGDGNIYRDQCSRDSKIQTLYIKETVKPVAWMYTSKWASNQTYITRDALDLTTYKADKVTPLYTAMPKCESMTVNESYWQEARQYASNVDFWHNKYQELLMAVGNKYPGETRHETALRYIRKAEMCKQEFICSIEQTYDIGDKK